MIRWFRDLFYWLHQSLWFIPLLLVLLTIGISGLMLYIDNRFYSIFENNKYYAILFRSPDGSREILSTIAGSMITITGVVFSVSLVAISLISSQFGPRVLPNFLKDRSNQFVLGIFISTFLYCLLILGQASWPEKKQVPAVSVLFGLFTALISMAFLIYFIHHIHSSIQISTIIETIAIDLEKITRKNYSKKDKALLIKFSISNGKIVTSVKSGYIQDYDEDGLLNFSEKHDLVIELLSNAGEFIAKDAPLVKIDKMPDNYTAFKIDKKITSLFSIGSNRTPIKDVLYSINQLEQIALRALSPGINDPLTALICMDRIGTALMKTASGFQPQSSIYDKHGKARIMIHYPDFHDLLYQGFEQILLFGKSNPLVLYHMAKILNEVICHANTIEKVLSVEEFCCAVKVSPDNFHPIHLKKLNAATEALSNRITERKREMEEQ